MLTPPADDGAPDFKPTVLNLERRIPFGSKELCLDDQPEGRANLTYRPRPTRPGADIGGGGTPIPPQIQQAQQLNGCIQAANGDIDKDHRLLDRFKSGQ